MKPIKKRITRKQKKLQEELQEKQQQDTTTKEIGNGSMEELEFLSPVKEKSRFNINLFSNSGMNGIVDLEMKGCGQESVVLFDEYKVDPTINVLLKVNKIERKLEFPITIRENEREKEDDEEEKKR